MDSVSSSVNKHKISQMEFDQLYLASLDDPQYRNIIDDQPHFNLPKLLEDHGFLLDLSGLNLRHRNFRYADFSGICLDYSDLRGSICHHADFTQVNCEKIMADVNSQFYEAKLTPAQLLQLQARNIEKPLSEENSPLGFFQDAEDEWSFA